MVMEHVGLGEAIEPDFPFVALALYEVPYPVLLFGRERPFAVFVLVVHLRAMQVLGDGLAHTGEVLFHNLVVECRETFRHHHYGLLVVQSAVAVICHVGHHTKRCLHTLRRMRASQIAYSGDTRSPIPVISVHSVCNLQYRRQS